MPDIVRVLLLALFPAAGNFAGGMLAEAIRTSRRSLSIALHLAAGIVFGVIAVELAPRTLESLDAWLAVTGFIAGGAAFIGLDALIERFQSSSADRSEEHTSERQSLMRTSYAVFCLKKKQKTN